MIIVGISFEEWEDHPALQGANSIPLDSGFGFGRDPSEITLHYLTGQAIIM